MLLSAVAMLKFLAVFSAFSLLGGTVTNIVTASLPRDADDMTTDKDGSSLGNVSFFSGSFSLMGLKSLMAVTALVTLPSGSLNPADPSLEPTDTFRFDGVGGGDNSASTPKMSVSLTTGGVAEATFGFGDDTDLFPLPAEVSNPATLASSTLDWRATPAARLPVRREGKVTLEVIKVEAFSSSLRWERVSSLEGTIEKKQDVNICENRKLLNYSFTKYYHYAIVMLQL